MDLEIIKLAAAIFIPFLILFFAAVIGVFRYFLKRFADDIKAEFAQLEAKIDKNDEKVLQVERDFMAFQVQLPKEYVQRADHIRVTAIIEKKVDGLGVLIMSLQGTLQGQQGELKLLLGRIGDINAKREKQNP